jgi:hypothetical protein
MIGYQEIKCHIIFDAKMDFTRKARFVAGGHMTQPASSITYSSVVSRDSVRIAFLLATLNGLKILACDIGNAYLNAPCHEKIWFQAGRECGEDAGKVIIITKHYMGCAQAERVGDKCYLTHLPVKSLVIYKVEEIQMYT